MCYNARMWKRNDLTKLAKAQLKSNYVKSISVSLLILFTVGGFSLPRFSDAVTELGSLNYRNMTHTQIVNELVNSLFVNDQSLLEGVLNPSFGDAGALANIFNNVTASGSFVFGLLNAMNQFLFQDDILPGVILTIGAIVMFLYYAFGKNILLVGKYRFFLENQNYTKTSVHRLLYIYEIGRTRHVAGVMFLRALYTVLWFFTIAGGFIKLYSYRMVPFIVAENPDVSAQEALSLSRRMMHGHKWHCFLFDLSFSGWYLLSYVTLMVADVLFVDPYYSAANAGLYMRLRENILQQDPTLSRVFNDRLLTPETKMESEYPTADFHIPSLLSRNWIHSDYHRRYRIEDLVFLFLAFAFIGYAWEVLYYLVETGTFINRGTLHGPWLPIYGFGGAGVVVLLQRFVDKPVRLFFMSILVCGTLEYTTAWFLETFLHTKWWDYTGFFLNLQGRICLEGLLVFGVGCMFGVYLLAPMFSEFYEKFPKKYRRIVLVLLSCAFIIDALYSFQHPNMAAGTSI